MPVTTLPLIIPAGQSLSAPLQVGLLKAVRIGMPDSWDAAPLTFMVSPDNGNYFDLFYVAETSAGMFQGYETGIQTIVPNTMVLLPAAAGLNVPWLMLRSGTRSRPINRAADRTFTIMFGD